MDCFTCLVDDTVSIGDDVLLFDNCNQIAQICNTISYEVLTSINHNRMKVVVE